MARNESYADYVKRFKERRESKQCSPNAHVWKTIVLCNVPVLKCQNCPATIFQGVQERTVTKREYRKFDPRKAEKDAHERIRQTLIRTQKERKY